MMQMDMFPVRVLVESVRPQRCISCAHDGCQLLDTFAIVSGQTPLGQLVDTVLSALGYPQLIQDSRGLIQINNWKPISFDTITDNKEEPVANLFKEISSSIVLKILTKHSSTDPHNSSQCIASIKHRLLKIAMEKQPHLLTTMDNQDIKETIHQLISGEDDTCDLSSEMIAAINEWLDQISNEPATQKHSIQATRGFNVIEVTKLERWFAAEQNPQRPRLLNFMNTLNNSSYRRAGSKVTYQQICNWFTTQRAFLRKQQQMTQSLQQQTLNGCGGGLAAIAVNDFNQLKNAFTSTNSAVTTSDMQMTEAFSSNTVTTASSSNFLNTPALGLMSASSGGSPITVSSTNASTAVSAAGSTAGTTEIPIATLPVDIASKFGASNGCNNLMDSNDGDHHIDNERIDGGSESPNGNDDVSIQSPSEPNGYDIDVKESGTSSPADMSIDVNAMSPSSNSMRHQTVGDIFNIFPSGVGGAEGLNAGQLTPATAAAAAAAAMFGLASNDNNGSQSIADLQRQNGINSAQNNQLMAAFSSLMPSLLGSGSPFNPNTGFLNGNGMIGTIPPQSSSPLSSSIVPHNGFGGNLKTTSNFFKDDISVKQEVINNNNNTPNNNNTARSRLMFDPLSELPVLERWFEENPHPGCLQIEQYTDKLNSCQYRQNYPPISTHNVKIWFKNRRAKCKRLNLSGNPGDVTPKSAALSV